MDPNLQALLIAALPVALSIYTLWSQRRKQNAETDISLSSAAMGMIQELRKQLAENNAQTATLMTRVGNLEDEVRVLHSMNDRLRMILANWRVGIRRLIEQVSKAGLVPAWEPAKEDEEGIE